MPACAPVMRVMTRLAAGLQLDHVHAFTGGGDHRRRHLRMHAPAGQPGDRAAGVDDRANAEPCVDAHAAMRIGWRTRSAAFSPIMIVAALVLPDITVGMIDASTTRRPSMP